MPSLHRGGTERHVSQILSGIKDRGWDVSIFLTSGKGPLVDELISQKINVVQPDPITAFMHNKRKIFRLPFILLAFIRLTFYLGFRKFDAVQFYLPEAYLIGGLSCLLIRQPNLIMNRRSLNNYQNKYPLLTKLEKYLHKKMAYVITNSKASVHDLQQEGLPKNKIRLIYNGISTEKFHIPHSLHDKETIVLLIVANIIPYKGHKTLIQALGKIKPLLPKEWCLMCAGKRYPYVADLQKEAIKQNISSHIEWLGECSEVEKLYAKADIAISASYEEGFSNSVLEAMAASLPVIATDVGGNPEAVEHGKTGLIVPPNDPHNLAEAILTLVNDKGKRHKFGKAGSIRADAYFSVQKCVDDYLNVYNNL